MIKAEITEKDLENLRESVKLRMSEKRYNHTLGVEREAKKLSEIYAPDKINKMRAAALLHDITKEYSLEKQLKICEKFGIIIGNYDIKMPKIFHSKTAAELICKEYPEYADEEIISSVRYHTTGRENMSICECIIFLADYIEDTRTFEDCVKLREYFYEGLAKCENGKDKEKLLADTMIYSLDMTVFDLLRENKLICEDTVKARNYFMAKNG